MQRRRERFFDNYVADLINRDVIQVSAIERGPQMKSLIRLLAARSGNLLTPAALAGDLGIARGTVENYIALLEQVFLIKRLPAWTRNLSARATRTPKLYFVDSGIAADQLGQTDSSLRRFDSPLGGLLEGFVVSEIARQLSWSRTRAELFHYRTKDQVEVDAILEDRRGRVVAIEVKSASTVSTGQQADPCCENRRDRLDSGSLGAVRSVVSSVFAVLGSGILTGVRMHPGPSWSRNCSGGGGRPRLSAEQLPTHNRSPT